MVDDSFFIEYAPKHKAACHTVFRFLKGRQTAGNIIQFTLMANASRIADNLAKTNILFQEFERRHRQG